MARDLAYRLYQICERNKWAEEARAYNGLIESWREIIKIRRHPARRGPHRPRPGRACGLSEGAPWRFPTRTGSAARSICLRDGLVPFVERELKAKLGSSWLKAVNDSLREDLRQRADGSVAWDTQGLFTVMDKWWGEVFRFPLGRMERSYINELRETRNDFAHEKNLHLRGHRARAGHGAASVARGLGRPAGGRDRAAAGRPQAHDLRRAAPAAGAPPERR